MRHFLLDEEARPASTLQDSIALRLCRWVTLRLEPAGAPLSPFRAFAC